MKLKLTIEVHETDDQDADLRALLHSRVEGTGITIRAFGGRQVDADLVDVERVAHLQEV